MAIAMNTDEKIRHILTATRRIALVGASDNPARASYGVMQYLLAKGYEVLPVNPLLAGKEILGRHVYGELKDIPFAIDMIDIFRNSEAAGDVVDEALQLSNKPKFIWMQLGVINIEAAARAEATGIMVVMNHCPKIEIPRLGL